jgi:hypothetical protein
MSRWAIRLPFRRGGTIAQALADTSVLEAEDRAVARIALGDAAALDMTLDDVQWALASTTRQQRREVLDSWRQRAGLKSTGRADDEQAFQRMLVSARYGGRVDLVMDEHGRIVDSPDAIARETAQLEHEARTRDAQHESRRQERAVDEERVTPVNVRADNLMP